MSDFAKMFQEMMEQMAEMGKKFAPDPNAFSPKAFEAMMPGVGASFLEMAFGNTINKNGLDAKTRFLVTIAALALGGAYFVRMIGVREPPPVAVGEAAIRSEFSLIDHNGNRVTEADFLGRWQLVFFGFTHCPDVCPTTLLRLASFMDQLGADAGKIQVVLFSVDPERDTPAVLKSYIASFDKRFSAVTGTPEQVKAFAKAYRIFYAKVPREGGDYTMNHSAGVFLFEKGGAFQGTLDLHEADDVAVAKLKMLAE